jgi:hypothetical protein
MIAIPALRLVIITNSRFTGAALLALSTVPAIEIAKQQLDL